MTDNLFNIDKSTDESSAQIAFSLILYVLLMILIAVSPAVVIGVWKAIL